MEEAMSKAPPKSRSFTTRRSRLSPSTRESEKIDRGPPRADRQKERGQEVRQAGTPPLLAPLAGRAQLLYGIHAVTAAWLNPRRSCRRLYATRSAIAAFAPTLGKAEQSGLKRPEPVIVEREALERLLPQGAVLQGIALDGAPLPEVDLEDVLIAAGDAPITLVLLDQVTDPHNIGAVLRSAAAFGASGLIVQSRHAPEITGVLAKAASGAVDCIPILRETNLSRTIERLRDAGFFVIGLDEEGPVSVGDLAFGSRVVLALGAEGVGLRRLVAENCTALASLPTLPPIGSLNVSNAAAIGLYEIARRRPR